MQNKGAFLSDGILCWWYSCNWRSVTDQSIIINSNLEFPLTFAHWNSQLWHIEAVKQSMAYTFPNHMCTSIQTQILILKWAEIFFQWGCENSAVTPELSVSTLCLLLAFPHLSSHRISSPLFPNYCLFLSTLLYPHFHPPLSFSIFVSFFLPQSRTNSNDILLHDINTARVIKHFLLQPDHCTDTESAVEIITGHWRKVRNNGPHKNGSER